MGGFYPINYNETINNNNAYMVRSYEGKVGILVFYHSLGSCKSTLSAKIYGCKLVYKRKWGVDWRIENYLARHVTKACSLKLGCNYKEIFSQVVMLKSIRTPIYYSASQLLDMVNWY